jgi:hypothetical protein
MDSALPQPRATTQELYFSQAIDTGGFNLPEYDVTVSQLDSWKQQKAAKNDRSKTRRYRAERCPRNKITKERRKQYELFLEKQKMDGLSDFVDICLHMHCAYQPGNRG